MSDAGRVASLVVLSAAFGAAMLWVFYRLTDIVRLRVLTKRLQAHLLAFRLFSDEPALIWRAQRNLLADNARLLALLLPVVAAAGFPTAWLMLQMECVYGYAPLAVGLPAVVSIQQEAWLAPVSLSPPAGMAVETEPLRISAEQRVCWRIRPTKPVQGKLRFIVGGTEVTKTVAAGEHPLYVSPRRVRSLAAFLLHPLEPRLPAGVRCVEVPYDQGGAISIAGIKVPWIVWFLVISGATALLLARRRRP
jgi:hypothetical protein